MEQLAVVLFIVCIGACSCINSWEVPNGDLWDYFNRDLDDNWMIFKKVHNKTYEDNGEEMRRRLFWEDTLQFIEKHNNKYYRGEETYYLGENHLSDLAEDEFQKIFLTGLVIPEDEVYPEGLTEPDPMALSDVDWRSTIVTPVKDQGSRCGSCWAFSANGALEGQLMKKKKSPVPDLSEQNLVDCDKGSYGCRGGWMNTAFAYMKNGVNSERTYPYRARKDYCRFRSNQVVARDTGFKKVGKTENSLQSDLSRVGPITIGMDAGGREFGSYRGGIYNNPRCNNRQANHAMLAVGYGSQSGRDYWTVKNSWSTGWGDKGYVYMTRNRNNQCGIANIASYPTL